MASSRLPLILCFLFSLCVSVSCHESWRESYSSETEKDQLQFNTTEDIRTAFLEDAGPDGLYDAVLERHGIISQMLDERSGESDISLPTPFDSLGNNFTQPTCRQFFVSFLSNSTFESCYPLSILLQNSQSFFEASGSAATLNPVVEASCAANMTTCNSFLSDLATILISSSNCAQDYSLGNPYVVDAYTALLAYEPIYRASCLKDPATQQFCFTESAQNATNVADYFVYFLGVGMPLPASSRPTCNVCVQATMGVFSTYAQIKGQPVAGTYLSAAQQIDGACGPNFANTNVAIASISAAISVTEKSNPWRHLVFSLLTALAIGLS